MSSREAGVRWRAGGGMREIIDARAFAALALMTVINHPRQNRILLMAITKWPTLNPLGNNEPCVRRGSNVSPQKIAGR